MRAAQLGRAAAAVDAALQCIYQMAADPVLQVSGLSDLRLVSSHSGLSGTRRFVKPAICLLPFQSFIFVCAFSYVQTNSRRISLLFASGPTRKLIQEVVVRVIQTRISIVMDGTLHWHNLKITC